MVAGLSGSDKTWRHPFPFQIVLKDKIKETFGTNNSIWIWSYLWEKKFQKKLYCLKKNIIKNLNGGGGGVKNGQNLAPKVLYSVNTLCYV